MPFPSEIISRLDFSKSIKILEEAEPFAIDPTSFKCNQTIKCESMNVIIVTSEYLIGGSDSSIKVWDLQSFDLKATLQGHSNSIDSLCANDKHIFSGSSDKVRKFPEISNQ
jgi:WD40 repeat protein